MNNITRTILSGLGLALLLAAPVSRAAVVNLPVAADTFLFSGGPDNNAGAQAWFDAGADGVLQVRRGLIRFNLASLPAGVTVNSAVLQLTAIKLPPGGGTDSNFEIYRLRAGWTEGTKAGNNGATATAGEATWNARMHSVNLWGEPGAAEDAAASPSASTLVGGTGGASYTWSGAAVAADVQHWLDHPVENFGWLLRSATEDQARTVRGFAARENGASAGTLQINYTVLNPVTLLNPGRSGSTFSFTFASEAGRTYVVRYVMALSGDPGQELTTVNGDGSTLTVTDQIVPGSQRFYRVETR